MPPFFSFRPCRIHTISSLCFSLFCENAETKGCGICSGTCGSSRTQKIREESKQNHRRISKCHLVFECNQRQYYRGTLQKLRLVQNQSRSVGSCFERIRFFCDVVCESSRFSHGKRRETTKGFVRREIERCSHV